MKQKVKQLAGNESEKSLVDMMKLCSGGNIKPPWVSMEDIMNEILKSTSFAIVHTPELHELFRDYLDAKSDEALSKITEEYTSFDRLQKESQLSQDSLIYLLLQLFRRGDVDIQVRRQKGGEST